MRRTVRVRVRGRTIRCMHAHTRACMHTPVHACTHACARAYTASVHVHAHTYTPLHI
jgi:hypothetical protein